MKAKVKDEKAEMEKMQRTRRVVNCRIYYYLQSELPFCTCLRMQGIYVCMYVRVQKGSPTAGYILGKRSRPPVSHIIKIERGARRHLIPILAASSGCAAARGSQAKKEKEGDGMPHAVGAEHRQSLQRTTILWRHSSICQTCFVIIKWKMLHFHVRQARDGDGDGTEAVAEDVAEDVAEAD